MRKSRILLVALAASVVLLAAPAVADNSVEAEAQATVGDNVTIDSVEIDDEGWVAVYPESVDGGPDFDGLLGAAQLIEGSNPGVVVDVEGLDDHGVYHAVLHYDESDEEEFDYPDDPVVTDEDDNDVTDEFFVAVGTAEILESYAAANQQKINLENRIAALSDQLDELEDEDVDDGDDDIQDEIDQLNDEISDLEDDLEDTESTIEETEDLLEQLDDDEVADVDDEDDEETDDEADDEEDDEEEPEGLPGFTAVTALIAALTAVALLARRR